jgi:hypothetical protein
MRDADTSDGKALTQTVDDGQQRGDVGRIARPHLRADRPPGAIDNQRQDHLAKIGPVILGIAMLAERLATFSVGSSCP